MRGFAAARLFVHASKEAVRQEQEDFDLMASVYISTQDGTGRFAFSTLTHKLNIF